MPAPRIRIEYDVMEQIAKKFFTQADLTDQSLKSLGTQMGTLQDGDWMGEGAKKFFSEMNSGVIPSVKGLSQALMEGGQVTQKISQVMRRADEDAARLIALPESGVAASGTEKSSPAAVSKGAKGVAVSQATSKAVDRVLSKVDPKVRALVKKSPTLSRQIQKLEGKVKFKMGPKGSKGTYYNPKTKEIVIAPTGSTNDKVLGIAHEVGHANYGKIPYHKPTTGMTKSEYIRKNVQEQMRDEGSAQLNAAIVRNEVIKAGGPTINMPGTQNAKYVKVYNDYNKGTITRKQATDKMATLMGNEKTSTNNKPYKDYYGSMYEKHWNKTVGKGKTKK
jgi:WXG100 family type VII secretion target